jgi:hypothetical protein
MIGLIYQILEKDAAVFVGQRPSGDLNIISTQLIKLDFERCHHIDFYGSP